MGRTHNHLRDGMIVCGGLEQATETEGSGSRTTAELRVSSPGWSTFLHTVPASLSFTKSPLPPVPYVLLTISFSPSLSFECLLFIHFLSLVVWYFPFFFQNSYVLSVLLISFLYLSFSSCTTVCLRKKNSEAAVFSIFFEK